MAGTGSNRNSLTSSGIPSQEFYIKNLPTKSVTLYPSRAHVVREIQDVILRPGGNEIVIHGITPTADEHSVQVDGRGAATITDITVELVPNREIFQEVYPEFDQSESEDDDEAEAEEEETPAEIQKLKDEKLALENDEKKANEIIGSAARRLETLDNYSRTLKAEHNSADDLAKALAVYEEERKRIFELHLDATNKAEACKKSIEKKSKALRQAQIPFEKKQAKERKAKEKERQRKRRQAAERRSERNRIREERLKFWPKKVYRVTVSLDASSNDTPASSRRGSMDSVTLSRGYTPDSKEPAEEASASNADTKISLSISYNTLDANWEPRYDLNVSSVQKTATIAYRAEFVNGTSETWKDAQIVLSTSQTSYQGLEDKVPFLTPWRVKLSRHNEQALMSWAEQNKSMSGGSVPPVINRNELFGSSQTTFLYGNKKQRVVQAAQKAAVQHQHYQMQQAPQAPNSNLFGAPFMQAPSGDTAAFQSYGAPGSNSGQHSNTGALFGRGGVGMTSALRSAPAPAARRMSRRAVAYDEDADEGEEHSASSRKESREDMIAAQTAMDMELNLGAGQPANLEYQESDWDDNGLTSTYDVPGVRTLAPSSLTRRHKIATLHATNINLSHIAVPKLRSAAFLRAKIRNPSSTVTLLKGFAGITLDGSFLGDITMKRVSPGQIFDLPLGVDPAVHIAYPKPSMHRSTQGIFNKESAQLFDRSVWVTNTKTTPIELLVLDQVPVSEDERLRIEIVQPRGLSKEGDVVRAGLAAKEGASGTASTTSGGNWGKATATLKKDGQIAWTANIVKKAACLLKLEYEAKMPTSEKITQA